MRSSLLKLAARAESRSLTSWVDVSAPILEEHIALGDHDRPRSNRTRATQRGHLREFFEYLQRRGFDVSVQLSTLARQPRRRAAPSRPMPTSPLLETVTAYLRARVRSTRVAADWASFATHTLWDLVEYVDRLGCRGWEDIPPGHCAAIISAVSAAAPAGKADHSARILGAFLKYVRRIGHYRNGSSSSN